MSDLSSTEIFDYANDVDNYIRAMSAGVSVFDPDAKKVSLDVWASFVKFRMKWEDLHASVRRQFPYRALVWNDVEQIHEYHVTADQWRAYWISIGIPLAGVVSPPLRSTTPIEPLKTLGNLSVSVLDEIKWPLLVLGGLYLVTRK
jgi:hypothetical protein